MKVDRQKEAWESGRWTVPRGKVTRAGPGKSLGPGGGEGGRCFGLARPFFWWKGEKWGNGFLGTARLKATDPWEKWGRGDSRRWGILCDGISILCDQAVFVSGRQCFYDSAGPLPARALMQSCALGNNLDQEKTSTGRYVPFVPAVPRHVLTSVWFTRVYPRLANSQATMGSSQASKRLFACFVRGRLFDRLSEW
jgi:hypothetical protein